MLCMSKTGDTLRNYCRMYPGLVNNTTIIWYMPWPEEALLEVATKYLKDLELLKPAFVEENVKAKKPEQ
jgi:dynein heavy chain